MMYKSIILLFAVSLCGCQQLSQGSRYIPNHNKDYLESEVVAPLNVPMNFSKPQDFETYPMPSSIPDPSQLAEVNLEPPEFGKL